MQQPMVILGRGDRLPNFALPDARGTTRVFYLEVQGGPIVLFACRSLRDPEAEAAFDGILALAGAGESEVELFVVTGDATADNLSVVERRDLGFPVFSDRDGATLRQLLAAEPPAGPELQAPPARCATYALDPNQRILAAVREPPAGQHGARALEALAGRARPAGPRLRLDLAAPVLTLPDVFEPALCRRLIEAWAGEHQEGGLSDGTRNVRDERKKRNLEHVVTDPELDRRVRRTLIRRIGPELAKVFNYGAPLRLEGLTVLSYRADRQDFFGAHRDNLRRTRQRRFAVSLNLNGDFEGGELRFPEYGPHGYCPAAGAAVVFSCELLHEALPVTRGQRWVLTTFFCDPA